MSKFAQWSVLRSVGLLVIIGCGSAVGDSNDSDGSTSGQTEGEQGNQEVCGGIQGIGCGEDQYCNLGIGNCCCDFQGTCEEQPEMCTMNYDPVCGCDGTTYGNACQAAAAGISIDREGECS